MLDGQRPCLLQLLFRCHFDFALCLSSVLLAELLRLVSVAVVCEHHVVRVVLWTLLFAASFLYHFCGEKITTFSEPACKTISAVCDTKSMVDNVATQVSLQKC